MLARIGDLELNAYDYGYVIESVSVVPELRKDGTKNKHAGKVTRGEPRYYAQIDQAVKKMASLVADKDAQSLNEWLKMWQDYGMAIAHQLKERK